MHEHSHRQETKGSGWRNRFLAIQHPTTWQHQGNKRAEATQGSCLADCGVLRLCCSLDARLPSQSVQPPVGRSGGSSAKISLSTTPWNHATPSSLPKETWLFYFPGQRGVWIIDLLLAGLTTEVWVCICCRDKSKEMAGWSGEHLTRALTMHLIYKQGEGLIYRPSVNTLVWLPPPVSWGNRLTGTGWEAEPRPIWLIVKDLRLRSFHTVQSASHWTANLIVKDTLPYNLWNGFVLKALSFVCSSSTFRLFLPSLGPLSASLFKPLLFFSWSGWFPLCDRTISPWLQLTETTL